MRSSCKEKVSIGFSCDRPGMKMLELVLSDSRVEFAEVVVCFNVPLIPSPQTCDIAVDESQLPASHYAKLVSAPSVLGVFLPR